ncbi:MAG: PEGA domain-containing protein [Treponema sp.]|nr:PEGA domain-containing protein [Treponema sp.]
MKKILFVLGLFTAVSFSPLFSQTAENSTVTTTNDDKPGSASGEAFAIIPELQAEETNSLVQGRTKAVFKTNVKNVSVYLNGNLQGRTNLTISSLVEGYYLLRLEKEGYQPQEYFVYIENSKEKIFYIEFQTDEEPQVTTESDSSSTSAAFDDAK